MQLKRCLNDLEKIINKNEDDLRCYSLPEKVPCEHLGKGLFSINAHCANLDHIKPTYCVQQGNDMITLHLFSNVLDLGMSGYFDLNALMGKITQAPGYNLCISASHYDTKHDAREKICKLLSPCQILARDNIWQQVPPQFDLYVIPGYSKKKMAGGMALALDFYNSVDIQKVAA